MRLTPRCIDLLQLLRTARWLTTSQINRRFFVATPDAVRKRLRKLTAGGYVVKSQHDRMSESLFTLGPNGRRYLEQLGADGIMLERKPPIQRDHFLAINDLRIAAELTGVHRYFYAAWELAAVGWKDRLIPDGLLAFGEKRIALEFDTGTEGVKFFVRSKMGAYQRGLTGLSVSTVVIVTDRIARMLALAKAIGDQRGKVLFTTLELIRDHGFLAPVFYAEPGGWGVSMIEDVSSQSLPSTREFLDANQPDINNVPIFGSGLLRQRDKKGAKHGERHDQ